nr:MAG TPA: hypothetical protein [Caudoviricetes sp.]
MECITIKIKFIKRKEVCYFIKWYKKSKNRKTKLRLYKHILKLIRNKKNYEVCSGRRIQ